MVGGERYGGRREVWWEERGMMVGEKYGGRRETLCLSCCCFTACGERRPSLSLFLFDCSDSSVFTCRL